VRSADEADEAERADAGGGRELVEGDVPIRPFCEVLAREAERRALGADEGRSRRTHRGRPVDERAQPAGEELIALEPRGGRLERAREGGVVDHRLGEGDGGERALSSSTASRARSATSTTVRPDVHGSQSTAVPACAACSVPMRSAPR
jgi:hypothetical protein